MTDLDKLKACLDDLDVTYDMAVLTGTSRTIVTISGKEGNVGGYSDAACEFTFNADGSKYSVDVWG